LAKKVPPGGEQRYGSERNEERKKDPFRDGGSCCWCEGIWRRGEEKSKGFRENLKGEKARLNQGGGFFRQEKKTGGKDKQSMQTRKKKKKKKRGSSTSQEYGEEEIRRFATTSIHPPRLDWKYGRWVGRRVLTCFHGKRPALQ